MSDVFFEYDENAYAFDVGNEEDEDDFDDDFDDDAGDVDDAGDIEEEHEATRRSQRKRKSTAVDSDEEYGDLASEPPECTAGSAAAAVAQAQAVPSALASSLSDQVGPSGRPFCSAKDCPNPIGDLRTLVACRDCRLSWHAPCLQMPPNLAQKIRARDDWQCPACRTCAVCLKATPGDASTLVACGDCDRAVHGHCALPPIRVPHRGYWNCNTTTHACALQDGPATARPATSARKAARVPRNLDQPSTPTRRRGRGGAARGTGTGRKSSLSRHVSPEPPRSQDPPEEKIHAIQTFQVPAADQELFEKMCEQSERKADRASSKLSCVQLGNYNLYTWYASPYPQEFAVQPKIYLCSFCLQYFKTAAQLQLHANKPHGAHPPHPPGDEIYRKGTLSIWEVDGRKHKVYAQNLCLLAKLFLDHKTLYYDVEPFLFYVLTEWEATGAALVGYFSKEKECFLHYNVSCIMTLPHHQRKGYGRMLIDFSYLLSRKEGKTGSPEKPLSDLGLLSYRRYWTEVILKVLHETREGPVSIAGISDTTALNAYDIISTLQSLGMIKYWRGKHVIVNNPELVNRYVTRADHNPATVLDPAALRWTPFVEASYA